LGNDSTLSLSTTAASIAGTLAVAGAATFDTTTLVVDATNNRVGINKATPTTTLDVSGTFAASGAATLSSTLAVTGNATFDTDTLFVDAANNRVGVGTITPAQALDVNGSIRAVGGSYDPTTSAWVNAAFATKVSASPYGGGFTLIDGTAGWTQYVIGAGANLVFAQGATSGAPSTYATLTNGGYFRLSTGGIQFNNDTAAANALDDYEEGTFTPTVAGSTTAGTATYTTQLARYTKIGRQVSCQIDLGYNSGTGTGNLTIAGLPFTDAGLNNPAVTIGYLDGITLTANNYALAYLASGTTRIDFVQIPTGGGSLTSVSYDSEGRIILNVTYTA
jgi:hypothetical protein